MKNVEDTSAHQSGTDESRTFSLRNEGLPLSYFTHGVVTRIPVHIASQEKTRLLDSLVSVRCLPVLPPSGHNDTLSLTKPWIFWPTDEFRQIGNTIYNNGIESLRYVLHSLKYTYQYDTEISTVIQSLQSRTVRAPVGFIGGDYQTVHEKKLFFYAQNRIPGRSDSDWICQRTGRVTFSDILELLKKSGWDTIPLSTENISLFPQSSEVDLDFLFFPFPGRDGKLHAITADAFGARAPDDCIIHPISDEEALRGGCNVADCGNGALLIHPHREDAPTTFEVLSEYSKAVLIETPRHYVEGKGGPRCLTSSFSLR